jgi:hypothetical protein
MLAKDEKVTCRKDEQVVPLAPKVNYATEAQGKEMSL